MPIPIALAIAAATSIYKGVKAHQQEEEAAQLKLRDTTPLAVKEALGLSRQAAASFLPGAGEQLNRIEGTTNNTLAAATRAGTSGSSILGLLERSDANRQQALANLDTRGQVYHQQANRELAGEQGVYQAHDLDTYDKNKAALSEASSRNMYGAVDGGAQVLARLLQQAKDNKDDGASSTDSSDVAAITPDQLKRKYNKFGIYDPTGGALTA